MEKPTQIYYGRMDGTLKALAEQVNTEKNYTNTEKAHET